MFKFFDKISKVLANKLIANTIWFAIANFCRVSVQAIYFILIARSLGVSEYGTFSGIVAFVGLFQYFVPWGSGYIMIKQTATNDNLFKDSFGKAVVSNLLGFIIIFTGLIILFPIIFPHKSELFIIFIYIALSDLFCTKFFELSCQVYQAKDEIKYSSFQLFAFSVIRLCLAIIISTSIFPGTAYTWSLFYLLSSCITGFVCMFIAIKKFGIGKLELNLQVSYIKEGFYFSLGTSATYIFNEIDKSVLYKLGTSSSTGIYSASYRIIDAIFTPISALLYSSYSKFFLHGENGLRGTVIYLKKLLPFTLIYGLFSIIIIYISRPLVIFILGNDYIEISSALLWLSPIILFRSVHFLFANALTGAGYQKVRSIAQIIISCLNLSINIMLIPIFGWRGAAWTSVISDFIYMLSLLIIVYILSKKRGEHYGRENQYFPD